MKKIYKNNPRRSLYLSFLIVVILSAFNVIPTLALNQSDLGTVTNGTVSFDPKKVTTTAVTNSVNSSVMEVNWGKFNIGTGETLTNSFSALNQTIIHRVGGLDLSTIAGTINSAGLGASSGKVVLINPNGFLFNGATINVNSLLATTLCTASVAPNQINLLNGTNKDINIYNSTMKAQNGLAFATNGNINVGNSTLSTVNGSVQLVTADGVNFKFVNGQTKAVYDSMDTGDQTGSTEVTVNNSKSASQIKISGSTINSDKGGISISTNSEYAANSDVIVYGNSALKAPNGTIYIAAINTSYRNDPKVLAYNAAMLAWTKNPKINKMPTYPQVDYYSNVIVKSNIDSAKDVHLSGTNGTYAQNITAKDSISLNGKYIKANTLKDINDPYSWDPYSTTINGNYNIVSVPSNAIIWGNPSSKITEPSVSNFKNVKVEVVPTDNLQSSNNQEVGKLLPIIANDSLPAMRNTSTLAGAAQKIRHKQSSDKFIGHQENSGSKIDYYEVLR